MKKAEMKTALDAETRVAVARHLTKKQLPSARPAVILALGVERSYWRSEGRWGSSARAQDGVRVRFLDEEGGEEVVIGSHVLSDWAAYEARRDAVRSAADAERARLDGEQQEAESIVAKLGTGQARRRWNQARGEYVGWQVVISPEDFAAARERLEMIEFNDVPIKED